MTRFAALCRYLLAVPLLLLPAWAGAWYVGAGLGQTNTEYVPTFNPANSSIEDSDTAYKLFFGNNLSPNFAFEVEYADLGTLVRHTAPGLNLRLDSTSLAVSALGRLPVYPGLTMFGRLGYGLWNADLDVNNVSGSKTSFAPVIGLGLDYNVAVTGASRFAIGLEWQQYQNLGEDTSAGAIRITGQNVDVFWLRLSYHFQLAPGP